MVGPWAADAWAVFTASAGALTVLLSICFPKFLRLQRSTNTLTMASLAGVQAMPAPPGPPVCGVRWLPGTASIRRVGGRSRTWLKCRLGAASLAALGAGGWDSLDPRSASTAAFRFSGGGRPDDPNGTTGTTGEGAPASRSSNASSRLAGGKGSRRVRRSVRSGKALSPCPACALGANGTSASGPCRSAAASWDLSGTSSVGNAPEIPCALRSRRPSMPPTGTARVAAAGGGAAAGDGPTTGG